MTVVAATTGLCTDSFIATTPSGVTTTTVCGTNSGQHSNVLLKVFEVILEYYETFLNTKSSKFIKLIFTWASKGWQNNLRETCQQTC